MNNYETRRLENIKRNAALVQDLGLETHNVKPETHGSKNPPVKRRKLESSRPTRTSARIANAPARPSYNEDDLNPSANKRARPREGRSRSKTTALGPAGAAAAPGDVRDGSRSRSPVVSSSSSSLLDVEAMRAGWTSWTPAAGPPTRDDASGEYHFASHPEFRPNKSPEEIIREGSFGGSYWRPLRSLRGRRLGAGGGAGGTGGITVTDDWRELPAAWTEGLDVARYLMSEAYDPEVNKYGVACGQSIEEWEAAGWIAHEYDVRGWFQWYCRFWMGRRCADDPRQISRWKKCVGETGRWRRILLKKYVQAGIRSVFDDGDEDMEDGGRTDVSPVVHQTCHHWAYEVRQEALERFWVEGR